jgi:hypothetical protein
MFLVDEGHKNSRGGCARMGGTEGGAPTKLKRNVSVAEHGYEKGSQRTWSRSMLHGWSSERCGRWPLGGGSVTRLTFLVKEVIWWTGLQVECRVFVSGETGKRRW